VSKAKKAANPEIKQDYSPEAGEELRGKEGENSYTPSSAEEEDGNNVNTGKLLEKVLERGNLNLAYKRVKKNGGSHSVDGMNVEELLPYLKQHGENLRQT